MTGLEFMRERKKANIDIPVIILSSIAHRGAAVTIECLELGASDFLLKPSNVGSEELPKVAERLVEMVRSYGGSYARKKGKKIPFFYGHLGRTAFGFSRRYRSTGCAFRLSSSGKHRFKSPNFIYPRRPLRPPPFRRCAKAVRLKLLPSVYPPAVRTLCAKCLPVYRRISASP